MHHLRNDECGFSLIELVIAVMVLAILAAIAIPNYLSSVRTARETAAIACLKQLQTAQEMYFQTNNGYADDPADLIADQYLHANLDDNNVGYGYLFELETGMPPPVGGGGGKGKGKGKKKKKSSPPMPPNVDWYGTADPSPADPNLRHFYLDQTGVIRFATGQSATYASTPIR